MKVLLLLLLGALCIAAAPSPFKDYLFYSYASWCPDVNLETNECYWCKQRNDNDNIHFEALIRKDSMSQLAYIVRHGNRIIVSFRGGVLKYGFLRASLKSLTLTNFNGKWGRYGGMKVARGFYQAWQVLEKDVVMHLRRLRRQYPSHRIILTGLSLGGALSEIAAVSLSYHHKINNLLVINFGSPRTGNEMFASKETL